MTTRPITTSPYTFILIIGFPFKKKAKIAAPGNMESSFCKERKMPNLKHAHEDGILGTLPCRVLFQTTTALCKKQLNQGILTGQN